MRKLISLSYCLLVLSVALSAPSFASQYQSRSKGQTVSISDAYAGVILAGDVAGLNQDEKDFVTAFINFKKENFKDAASQFKKLVDKLPLVSDHIYYCLAAVSFELGEYKDASGYLDKYDEARPNSVLTFEALTLRAKIDIALKDFKGAQAVLNLLRGEANPARKFEVDVLKAKTLAGAGNAEVVGFARSLALSVCNETEFKKVEAVFSEIKNSLNVDLSGWISGPEQQFLLAKSFADCSQWDEVAARLEKLLKKGPLSDSLRAQVEWVLARALRFTDRYDEAIKIMEGLEKKPNIPGMRDDVLNTLATTYTKKNQYQKAIDLRLRMIDMYPSTASLMMYKVAFLYMDEGKYEEAIKHWNRAAARLSGEKKTLALWYLAWCHYMAQQYEQAINIFGKTPATVKNLNIKDRLLYWKGRAYENLGKQELAAASFRQVLSQHPYGYYAELAKRRLAGDKRDVRTFALLSGSENTHQFEQKKETKKGSGLGATRADFFKKLGFIEEAAKEAELDIGTKSVSQMSLLRELEEHYVYDTPFRVVESAHKGLLKTSPVGLSEYEREIFEFAYPRAYEAFVSKLAQSSDVDARIVWSIMRNESAFRPEVTSPVGAAGLMQLMPTTANRLAKENNSACIDRVNLYRTSVNITLGVDYLKKLADMFPKNPVAWIASYNAGEQAVARWIKNGDLKDIEEWIEEIPYSETNLYVKKVLLSYWKYQKLYYEQS